jgi:hypothetical protein
MEKSKLSALFFAMIFLAAVFLLLAESYASR